MIKFGNFVIKDNNSWLGESSSPGPTPPTPPVLPANTVRVRTSDGNAPVKGDSNLGYETATLVEGTTDVYDVYKSGDSFYCLLNGSTNVTEVIAANTTGITNMRYMFDNCTALTTVPLFDTSSVTLMSGMFYQCGSLTSVPLFDTSNATATDSMFYSCSSLATVPLYDTSNVTNMYEMFRDCSSLTSIPLFDTSSCSDMRSMFYNCVNVESGALALYQQASTQANPPSRHRNVFTDCGINTVTGTAELAQIPSDWK